MDQGLKSIKWGIGLVLLVILNLANPGTVSATTSGFANRGTTPLAQVPIAMATFRFEPLNIRAILNCSVQAIPSAAGNYSTPEQFLAMTLSHTVRCTDSSKRNYYYTSMSDTVGGTIRSFNQRYGRAITFLDMNSCPENFWRHTMESIGKKICVYNPGYSTNPFPLLVNGSGFTAPTTQPANIGNSSIPGYDAKAIARWDVVPLQMISGRYEIGVVAFHINGIDRVEFSMNDGPWTAISQMKLNPRSGVYEYVAAIDTAGLTNGNIEIRAKVIPKSAGIVRVLQGSLYSGTNFRNGNHSLFLVADINQTRRTVYCAENGRDDTSADGTEARPFRQPAYAARRLTDNNGSTDFSTIYLKPGRYSFGPAYSSNLRGGQGWLTITAAPNAAVDEVFLDRSGTAGIGAKNIKLQNLTILKTPENSGPRLAGTDQSFLWIDQAKVIGNRTVDYSVISPAWWAGVFVTKTYVHNSRNGLRSADFMRDVQYGVTSGSPFGSSPFIVNSTVEKYDNSGTEFHGDVVHWYQQDNNRENYIIYGLHAPNFKTQAIFAEELGGYNKMDNVAIVNFHAALLEPGASGSWWERDTNHFLLWHVSLPDQPMRWSLSAHGSTVRNVSIKNSVFKGFSYDDISVMPNVVITNNHFTASTTVGQNATTGELYNAINDNGFMGYDGPAGALVRNSGAVLPINHPGDGRNFVGQTKPNRGAFSFRDLCSGAEPQALIAAKNRTVFSSFDIQLYGSGSTGCRTAMQNYAWTFSDGSSLSGANVSKTFAVAETSTHTARLSVRNGGVSSGMEIPITVLPLPEPRMLAYYKFNDNVLDETLRHIDGTWATAVYGVGRNGSAAQLSGAPITMPADAFLGIDRVTISIWAKRSTSSANGHVLYRHPDLYGLELGAGRVSARLKTGVTGAIVDRTLNYSTPSDTQWHHYVLRYDGQRFALFVDGVKRTETTMQGPVLNYGTWHLNVGNRLGGSSPFNGLVDELKIYHKALSDAEIQAQFSGT